MKNKRDVFVPIFLLSLAVALSWILFDYLGLYFGQDKVVAFDFVTGLLTFDGIMIAAMVLFDVKVKGTEDGILRRRVVWVIFTLFAGSSFSSLTSIRGFSLLGGTFPLVELHQRLRIGFGMSVAGIIIWFFLSLFVYWEDMVRRWVH